MHVYNLLGTVTLPIVGGYISSVGSHDAIDTWYSEIQMPKITPPKWAFPVVWTALYGTMGYASYLVGSKVLKYIPLESISVSDILSYFTQPKFALYYYGVQLAFNYAWSPLFFKQRKLKLAFVDSALLNLLLVPTTISFWKADAFAGKLMVPYFVWVTIATYINFDIYRTNDERRFKRVGGVWRYIK
jgi:benzodiazapine receptor